MKTILVDHDIEDQVLILWGALSTEGGLALCPLELVTFVQVGFPVDSDDRTVWRFAQAHGMILLSSHWEELIVSEKVPIASVALSA